MNDTTRATQMVELMAKLDDAEAITLASFAAMSTAQANGLPSQVAAKAIAQILVKNGFHR
ncbi:hypothetical protein ACFVUS_12650 [Nocardia sp. NPDC058058]|uniref:hypothetical protein n=1 Tax=Nocardia sp. NPDC058058 TaxID=3346317 RepID=UPI0036DA94F3